MIGRGGIPVIDVGDPFPSPHTARGPLGIVALGGDLATRRVLDAYRSGIFPWGEEGGRIVWASPEPRCVLFPDRVHVARRLQRTMRTGRFRVTIDERFGEVIRQCAATRSPGRTDTWITRRFVEAYERMHREGLVHSYEVWIEDRLVGGLYGLSLGRAWFGESMYSVERDASKVAFVHLARDLERQGFHFLDCQLPTMHLLGFGTDLVSRRDYLDLLAEALAGGNGV